MTIPDPSLDTTISAIAFTTVALILAAVIFFRWLNRKVYGEDGR